jgi:hypothetical protein
VFERAADAAAQLAGFGRRLFKGGRVLMDISIWSDKKKWLMGIVSALIVAAVIGITGRLLRTDDHQKQEDGTNVLVTEDSQDHTGATDTESTKGGSVSPSKADSTPAPDVVSVVKVVTIHVGGDDSKADTFTYKPPAGYIIKDFKMIERSRGGDADYHSGLISPTQLDINWSVKSRTVRGPFKMVIDTKTAFLDLDVEITLKATPKPGAT